jgi:hypothetical protein
LILHYVILIGSRQTAVEKTARMALARRLLFDRIDETEQRCRT